MLSYDVVTIDTDDKVKPRLDWCLIVRVLEDLEAVRALVLCGLSFGVCVESGNEAIQSAKHAHVCGDPARLMAEYSST